MPEDVTVQFGASTGKVNSGIADGMSVQEGRFVCGQKFGAAVAFAALWRIQPDKIDRRHMVMAADVMIYAAKLYLERNGADSRFVDAWEAAAMAEFQKEADRFWAIPPSSSRPQ